MRKRKLASFILFFVLSLLMSTTLTLGAAKKTTITVLSWRYDPAGAIWQTMIKAFNQKYPDIEVVGIMTPHAEMEQKVTTMLAGGLDLDVVWTDSGRNYAFASKGLLEDLSPYFAKDNIDLKGDYFAKSISDHMYNGKVYGWPAVAMTYLIFYNKDLFDAAGVAYPENNWTMEEFLTTAHKMTDKSKNQYGYNIRPWAGTHDLAFIKAFGGSWFNEDGTKSAFNSPNSVKAFQFLRDLIYKEQVAPSPTVLVEQSGAGFDGGKIAMNWSGTWDIAGTETTPSKWPFRWGVVMPPKGPNGQYPIVISNAWALVSRSKNKDAAWTFIKWWMSEEGQTILAQMGEFPTLKSVAQRSAFTHLSAKDRQTIFDATALAISRPSDNPAYARTEREFTPYRDQLFLNRGETQTILDEAVETLNIVIQDVQQGW